MSSWPALSLRQPWLWAVLELDKDVENRRWNTRYRGPVWLHAALGCTKAEIVSALAWMTESRLMNPSDERWPGLEHVERGGVCGVADIYDVVLPTHREPLGAIDRGAPARPWHMREQYGLLLRNVRRVELVPCRGALGMFRLPPDVEQAAVAALARAGQS